MKQAAKLTLYSCFFLALVCASCSLSACAQIKKQSNSAGASQPLKSAQKPEEAAERIPQEPIGTKQGDIFLAYPRGENNNKIESASTFLVGTVPAGRTLSCNDTAINPNAQGFFCHVVKLNFGQNIFKLVLSGQESNPMEIKVERPAAPAALGAGTFNILPETLEPKEALGVSQGDIVQFAARATSGCQMSVQIGSHKIAMKAALGPKQKGKGPSVNLGLDTAFGVSFQRNPAALKDLYLGFYKIQPEDKWKQAVPVFILQQGKKTIKAKSKGSITVLQQPILLETTHSNTIVRVGPGADRLTPLPSGIRLVADGYKADWWRLELCPQHHAWIAKEDLQEDDDSAALPQSKVTTVNLGTDDYGARIAVPLNQRLPFHIEQDLGAKKLLLKIYGATASTDFVTSDL
ncbi:MAG: hypothetical protein K2X81_10285, partial [Candidatus Obscuribacterales bacterium]|nr:hypothetical protein [Candidatus Obscuribacterales bacterium]